jgi:hypothetical protein
MLMLIGGIVSFAGVTVAALSTMGKPAFLFKIAPKAIDAALRMPVQD